MITVTGFNIVIKQNQLNLIPWRRTKFFSVFSFNKIYPENMLIVSETKFFLNVLKWNLNFEEIVLTGLINVKQLTKLNSLVISAYILLVFIYFVEIFIILYQCWIIYFSNHYCTNKVRSMFCSLTITNGILIIGLHFTVWKWTFKYLNYSSHRRCVLRSFTNQTLHTITAH